MLLARTYIRYGLGDRALLIAREAAAIAPGTPDTLELLGTAQLLAGQHSAALTTFRDLAKQVPNSSLAQIRLAEAQIAQGDSGGAENAYRKALALSPDSTEAMTGLAKLHARERRLVEALKLADELQKRQSKSSLGHALVGDLNFDAKRYPEAVEAYGAALSAAPSGELVVRRHAAQILMGEKPGDAALTQWLARYPNDVAVRFYLANQRYAAGKYREAVEHYEVIVQSNPHRVFAFNNMASAYLKLNDPRALATAEAAYRLMPEDASILDTLGVAQTHFGKAETALETLRKAIARRPDETTFRVSYALALAKTGDKVAARAELKSLVGSAKAVSLDAEAKALLEDR